MKYWIPFIGERLVDPTGFIKMEYPPFIDGMWRLSIVHTKRASIYNPRYINYIDKITHIIIYKEIFYCPKCRENPTGTELGVYIFNNDLPLLKTIYPVIEL